MATVAELEDQMLGMGVLIAELGAKLDALTVVGRDTGQCTPDYPHIGELSYSTGRYLCRCGMRYSKDGRGALRVEN